MREKQISDTRTAAPSTTHGSSLHASKIGRLSVAAWSARRFAHTPNGVGCDKPCTVCHARFDLLARFLEPVTDQIGFCRYTISIGLEHLRYIVLAQVRNQALATQKWWVADDDIGIGPGWLGSIWSKDRVPALDRIQRLQDRVTGLHEPIAPHPLDLADPDRHSRKLRRIEVNFDPLDIGRSNHREGPMKAKCFCLPLHPMLQVLELLQGEI